MPLRYYKWIFVSNFSDHEGKSYDALLKPLEEICEKAGEGYAFHSVVSFARRTNPVFRRKYFVAGREGKMSLIEHEVYLNSRTRATTVMSEEGYEHTLLLEALHKFYSQDEGYKRRNPEIADPFIVIKPVGFV